MKARHISIIAILTTAFIAYVANAGRPVAIDSESDDTRVLRIENGRAYGSFRINSIPFYSGFFEIRAYTKYMMNFGPETAYDTVGVVLTSQGIMKAYSALASSFRKLIHIAFDRKDLPAGVAEVTLINNQGNDVFSCPISMPFTIKLRKGS